MKTFVVVMPWGRRCRWKPGPTHRTVPTAGTGVAPDPSYAQAEKTHFVKRVPDNEPVTLGPVCGGALELCSAVLSSTAFGSVGVG